MIELTVNGKPRSLDGPLSLSAYLEQLGINPQIIAVEHNGGAAVIEQFLLRSGPGAPAVRTDRAADSGSRVVPQSPVVPLEQTEPAAVR